MFTVNLHGSDPDLDNDDCWTGDSFPTLEEAERIYQDPVHYFNNLAKEHTGSGYYSTGELWAELDGPGVNKTRCVRRAKRNASSVDDEWRSEQAMQAGMAFGVDGYNDVMGW